MPKSYGSRFGQVGGDWTPGPIDEACRNFLTDRYLRSEPPSLLLRDEWLAWCEANPQHGYDLETAERVFWEVKDRRYIGWDESETPLRIEPNEVYALEVPQSLSMVDADLIRQRFEGTTGARCIVLSNGIRLTRDSGGEA